VNVPVLELNEDYEDVEMPSASPSASPTESSESSESSETE